MIIVLSYSFAAFAVAPEPFTFKGGIATAVQQQDIRSLEGVLDILPQQLLEHFALFYGTDKSNQFASFAFPRVVLVGRPNHFTVPSNLLIAWSGHPTQRGFHNLEAIDYDPEKNRYEFYQIQFDPAGANRAVIRYNPTECLACHSRLEQPAAPIWPSRLNHPQWPLVYGGERSDAETMEIEIKKFATFLRTQGRRGRYRYLTGLKDHVLYEFRDLGRFGLQLEEERGRAGDPDEVRFDRYQRLFPRYGSGQRQTLLARNFQIDANIGDVNGVYAAKNLMAQPGFRQIRAALLAALVETFYTTAFKWDAVHEVRSVSPFVITDEEMEQRAFTIQAEAEITSAAKLKVFQQGLAIDFVPRINNFALRDGGRYWPTLVALVDFHLEKISARFILDQMSLSRNGERHEYSDGFSHKGAIAAFYSTLLTTAIGDYPELLDKYVRPNFGCGQLYCRWEVRPEHKWSDVFAYIYRQDQERSPIASVCDGVWK